MRIRLLLFLLFACCFQSQAQIYITPDTTSEGERAFVYVGEMPKFRGSSDLAFAKYIKKKIIYPKDAERITGTMYLTYIIDKDGSVTNVKIVPGKGLYPPLDQAVIDVIRNSPKWTPGKNNGVPVAVSKIVRIKF